MRRIAVIALAALLMGSNLAWAGHDDAQLRNATLKRSHGSVWLLIRAKGLMPATEWECRSARTSGSLERRRSGIDRKHWVIAPTGERRRSLLHRARKALKSGRPVRGAAVIDDDPLLPDPAHRFTLRAFNKRAPIAR